VSQGKGDQKSPYATDYSKVIHVGIVPETEQKLVKIKAHCKFARGCHIIP
jgi:hypothetical protein